MIFDPDKHQREERREGSERRQEVRRADDVVKAAQPSVDELRALAATVRNCQRNGHPDLSKHLDALLTKLGA
jgi:hypothetical protein